MRHLTPLSITSVLLVLAGVTVGMGDVAAATGGDKFDGTYQGTGSGTITIPGPDGSTTPFSGPVNFTVVNGVLRAKASDTLDNGLVIPASGNAETTYTFAGGSITADYHFVVSASGAGSLSGAGHLTDSGNGVGVKGVFIISAHRVSGAPTDTSPPTTTKPATNKSANTPPAATAPPSPPQPSTSLAPVSAPNPPAACNEVKSTSGSIDICVPPELSVSSTPGVRLINSGGGLHVNGEFPQGATMETGAGGGAQIREPSGGILTAAANTGMTWLGVAWNPKSPGTVVCDAKPAECTKYAGIEMGASAFDALTTAMAGNPLGAMYTIAKGEINLTKQAINSVKNASATLSGSSNAYVTPDQASGASGQARESHAQTAHASTTASGDVEIQVVAEGTWFYVLSGKWFLLNASSGKYTIVSAGQEVYVPKKKADAKSENLARNTHTFKISSAKQWW